MTLVVMPDELPEETFIWSYHYLSVIIIMMNFISTTTKEIKNNVLSLCIHTTYEDNSEDGELFTFKNLTPHPINLVRNSETLSIPNGEVIPRVGMVNKSAKIIAGLVPIRSYKLTEVDNLPRQENDTYLIVSRMVAEALPNRTDLLFPDRLIRDGSGNIVGCKGLASL